MVRLLEPSSWDDKRLILNRDFSNPFDGAHFGLKGSNPGNTGIASSNL
jgi:hypothetical protein